MRRVKMYGHSDDLVEFEGVTAAIDEAYPSYTPMAGQSSGEKGGYDAEFYETEADKKPVVFLLSNERGEQLLVSALYAASWIKPDGETGFTDCWSVLVSKASEDDPWPTSWQISIQQHSAYSPALIIEMGGSQANVKRIA